MSSKIVSFQIHELAEASWQAFQVYQKRTVKERARFLEAIAGQIEREAATLIAEAHKETHLEEDRLRTELKRTIFQLTSYAAACARGNWLDVRIDTADADRQPLKPDIRKTMIPLGPVAVFGASNFPFAYSTAGGDTACALAAGCTVILKAHSAHAQTSGLVAKAVQRAAAACGLPFGVFLHYEGEGFEGAQALVTHPLIKAVGFTGSFEGGKALSDLANTRPVPIPVFAEMGSINPVFLLPEKLAENTEAIADALAVSITQSAGQFCTNPGLIVLIDDETTALFLEKLSKKINKVRPQPMLHRGIAKNFYKRRKESLSQNGVALTAQSLIENKAGESIPTIAANSAAIDFIQNPVLHKEVFGPYSLVVKCKDTDEMVAVANSLEGQLTATIWAKDEEIKSHILLADILTSFSGRMVLNGVPTGVEVCLAMHHGGPYPATTDSRFTAVGADGIKRFTRPVTFQNWNNDLLPEELRDGNPLKIQRTVNNKLTYK